MVTKFLTDRYKDFKNFNEECSTLLDRGRVVFNDVLIPFMIFFDINR